MDFYLVIQASVFGNFSESRIVRWNLVSASSRHGNCNGHSSRKGSISTLNGSGAFVEERFFIPTFSYKGEKTTNLRTWWCIQHRFYLCSTAILYAPKHVLSSKSGLITTKPKLVELPRASCGHVTYQMTFQYREGDQKPFVFGGYDLRTISQNSKPKIFTTLKNQIHYWKVRKECVYQSYPALSCSSPPVLSTDKDVRVVPGHASKSPSGRIPATNTLVISYKTKVLKSG